MSPGLARLPEKHKTLKDTGSAAQNVSLSARSEDAFLSDCVSLCEVQTSLGVLMPDGRVCVVLGGRTEKVCVCSQKVSECGGWSLDGWGGVLDERLQCAPSLLIYIQCQNGGRVLGVQQFIERKGDIGSSYCSCQI